MKRVQLERYAPIRVRGGHKNKIGYARVSTRDQNLDSQIEKLTRAGCCMIFAEHVSGAAEVRPAFAAMLEAVREGDTVVVCNMDRLGRKVSEAFAVIETFRSCGVELESLAEQINTRGPHNTLTVHVLLVCAELVRKLNNERTREGVAAARARGNFAGRPTQVDETKLDRILYLKSKGHSLRNIAHEVGVGKTTVHRAIEEARQLKIPGT